MNNRLNYNPDVLSCLANLSNDEVFTPPQLANQMLDMLPQELFHSSKTKFLDPCTKSGVFLREIAKRLIDGLQEEIPDLQERIDHIMHRTLKTMMEISAMWRFNIPGRMASAVIVEPPKKCMIEAKTLSHMLTSLFIQIILKNYITI